MSDEKDPVERWQAPFFDPSRSASSAAQEKAQGFEEGKCEGLDAGRAEAQDIVQRMTELADAMAQPFLDLDRLVVLELARVAMLLAEKIVRRELAIDSAVVVDVVAEALATLYRLEGEIVIFLNPVDIEMVRKYTPEALEGKAWKLVEDENLLAGGCQIKTPTSFVDASVEKRMELVFASLFESAQNTLEP